MKNVINAGYGIPADRSHHDKLLTSQYHRMFNAFLAFKDGSPTDTVLDVRASARSISKSCNYSPEWTVSQAHSQPSGQPVLHEAPRVTTSCEIDLQTQANPHCHLTDKGKIAPPAIARKLCFDDGQFDWVYCNGLIEHAGSFERQYELLKELTRVARKGVFVTSANRWFPFEFNTGLPLLHWLPLGMWRRMLKVLGRRLWASEAVLNPLDSIDLKKLATLLPGKQKSDVGHVRICGIKAHFFLMVRKGAEKVEK